MPVLPINAFCERFFSTKLRRDALFLSTLDGDLSYTAFTTVVQNASGLLAQVLCKRQTLVFIVCENHTAFIVALFALNYLAQVAVPVFPGYAREELRALYNAYRPSLVIADAPLCPIFAELGARLISSQDLLSAKPRDLPGIRHYRQDVSMVLLTSGSRSAAKGVVLSNGNILADLAGIQKYMDLNGTERCLIVRSLTHASALVGELLLTAVTGGACVLKRTPNTMRKFFEWCETSAITWLGISPALLRSIEEYGRNHSCHLPVQRVVVSGAILSLDLCLNFLETFPKTELINAYGLTEASPRVAYLPAHLARLKAGSAGYPITGCRVRVTTGNGAQNEAGELGEIEVAGPNVMRGYFPEGLTESRHSKTKWLKTGDMGYLDKDGALHIMGRRDTMFVHNGINVHPEYIASVLEKAPSVRHAVVSHMMHPQLGLRLIAFVAIDEGETEVSVLGRIRIYLKEHLESRKHPEEIVVVPQFPLTPSGKTDIRRLLEDHFHSGWAVIRAIAPDEFYTG